MFEGKIRFPLCGKAEWLLLFLLASSHLRMCLTCTRKHGSWPVMWYLPCFSSFALSNTEMSPATLGSLRNAAQVPYPCAGAACSFMGCKGERPCIFSASHEFCETAPLFHFCLFLFPGFWHKPLREIVGSGNNVMPYNLLYLKVPLSSEANSLSLDSVYDPLLLFSHRIPFVVQANIHLMGIFYQPSG